MEVLWKMALRQSALSHSPGMILGKNKKRGGERIHEVKVKLCYTVISLGQNVLGEKYQTIKNQSLSNIGGNQWKPYL